MLFFLAYSLTFVLILSRLLRPWPKETRVLSPVLCQKFLRLSIDSLKTSSQIIAFSPKGKVSSAMEALEQTTTISFLDLPDPILETILCNLSPPSLCKTAMVCSSLKQICFSDQIWELHMNRKWNHLIRHSGARRAWNSYISSINYRLHSKERSSSFMNFLLWPRSKFSSRNQEITKSLPDSCSIMKWYSALESGRFSLPAQVYNRENGHAGFMLSCYDAELFYDHRTDTFSARYPPNGKRMAVIENGVQWDRVRAPPIDISGQDLYTSECLSELRPGDHVEIQWRRSKDFSYGWWYGVVGHLESCSSDGNYCRCHCSDKLVVEFKQYSASSQWRKTAINRRDHSEEGGESSGFYGGLRRLQKEEISTWRRLWPTKTME